MKEDRLAFKEAKNIFIKRSFYCCILALLLCWVMKLVGFDYFNLDLDNKFFNDLDLFLDKYYLKNIFSLIILNLELYFMCCSCNKEDGKKIIIYILKVLPLTIIIRILSTYIGTIGSIIEIIYISIILTKFKFNKLLKSILIVLISILYQTISLNMRSLNLKAHSYTYIASMILTIDYIILLYLHKEMEVNNMGDTSWFFFGLTAWIYAVAGFIVGIFTLHPITNAQKWYAKGKEKENVRKAKRELKKAQRK